MTAKPIPQRWNPRLPAAVALAALMLGLLVPSGPTTAQTEFTRTETEHFIIQSVEGVGAETIEMTGKAAEEFFADLSRVLGSQPKMKLTLLLQGSAERPDGSWGYPRVDGWGRIHLYEYDGIRESYLSPLAHELVHAFRLGRRPHASWFFEEGFAEFVSLRVDPSLAGFPWYGFPVNLVAGQWIASEEDIPMGELRERHDELNLPCKAQSYSLRASFFDFLGRTRGDDAVYEMANEKRAGEVAQYAHYFGQEFDELVLEWREHVRTEFQTMDEAKEKAAEYRQQTPVQYMPVCGKD